MSRSHTQASRQHRLALMIRFCLLGQDFARDDDWRLMDAGGRAPATALRSLILECHTGLAAMRRRHFRRHAAYGAAYGFSQPPLSRFSSAALSRRHGHFWSWHDAAADKPSRFDILYSCRFILASG